MKCVFLWFFPDDPSTYEFDADRVRSHMASMIRMRAVRQFPFVQHCYCAGAAGGHMVACDSCSRWFHRSCLSAGNRVTAKGHWMCRQCR